MAAKAKKQTKLFGVDPTSESIALGSAFSVLFLVIVKSFLLAGILGLIFAFTHWFGVNKKTKKVKQGKKK